MCNNSGSVYCESCDHVIIEGITWDRCGDPNGTNIAGVTFNGTSNILLVNCTFQHSQLPAVALLEVSEYVSIHSCKFLSNIPLHDFSDTIGILSITRSLPPSSNRSNITAEIVDSYFYDNGYFDSSNKSILSLYISILQTSIFNCNIFLAKSTFMSNRDAIFININILRLVNIQLTEMLVVNNSFYNNIIGAGIILFINSNTSNVTFSILYSNFSDNHGCSLWCYLTVNEISFTIDSANFTNSKPIDIHSTVPIIISDLHAITKSTITFYKVQFSNFTVPEYDPADDSTGVAITTTGGDVNINMYMVNFTSNKYFGNHGNILHIELSGNDKSNSNISLRHCEFVSNVSPDDGAVLYIGMIHFHSSYVQIVENRFDQNIAGNGIVYITQNGCTQKGNVIMQVFVTASEFTNNVASSMYLSACKLKLSGTVFFKNNTARNGGAMYVDQGTIITIDDNATVQFIGNTATLNGGAIYVDLLCKGLISKIPFWYDHFLNCSVMFINNSAIIAGNSIYLTIPEFCSVNTNINDLHSILHVPCQFNYSQPVDGKMMNIPCDVDYTLLNGTGAPIVTSPHELRLYFPFNDGYNVSVTSDYKIYFISNNILGHPVKFTGAVFDYFGKPTEPTLFNIQMQYLYDTNLFEYSLIGGNRNHLLIQSVDNVTVLSINFRGKKIDPVNKSINLIVTLKSLAYSHDNVNVTLVVEIVPCANHPGYTYSEMSQTCVCYHANVKCYADGNEIKRGYWFGSIASKTTTSLCPNHYCKLTDRKQTSEGYFELPNTIDAQCNDHRVGRACGKCKSGYTLSYDSTDCIRVDQCGTGWTVLVIILTFLYWIIIVVGVFSLMYFKFQISSGYLYGIIYYYSMVGILLNNNPYVSDDAFEFVSILSSFAQLTPQFLGKICFMKDLSGIDQLFIHYSHAVGVSILLLLIVVSARFSTRITLFVSRCIIRVICLLMLLSYTSIASTSLQLLLPLKFTDIKEWYTYSSPSIQYLHGRHAVYGIVAVLCELVVGIGLPMLLLLEPFLNRKINFIRIKPLLDQFQGCYKDKYRWFASYYLICRQVIFLIMYLFSSNYYNMLFYLQTACLIIAMIHLSIQPYQDELLNTLDGIMLSLIVLEVNINTFSFLKNVTTEIVLVIMLLPFILFGIIAVKRLSHYCFKKWHYRHYNPINDDDYYCDDDDDDDGDERIANVLIRYFIAPKLGVCM